MTWVTSAGPIPSAAASASRATCVYSRVAARSNTRLRTPVVGFRNRPVPASKKTGSPWSGGPSHSASALKRRSMPEESKAVETSRFPRRLRSGCAARTSRTASWCSSVAGTAVSSERSVTVMAAPFRMRRGPTGKARRARPGSPRRADPGPTGVHGPADDALGGTSCPPTYAGARRSAMASTGRPVASRSRSESGHRPAQSRHGVPELDPLLLQPLAGGASPDRRRG